MKYKYSFILGHSAEISLSEIFQVLNLSHIKYSVIEFNNSFLIIDTNSELDINFLMRRLGGIIKIGIIYGEFRNNQIDKIQNFLFDFLIKNANHKKLKIGFSYYNLSNSFFSEFSRNSFALKKRLRQEKIQSRIITSKKQDLSAVIVNKEKLISDGFDFQILAFGENIFIAKTLCVQDYEKFSIIDYNRPKIDAVSGMMPPKLAQIMLNLSGKNDIVYDPFCGSGTILLMAGELNYKKIIASDILSRAVSNSIENLKWYENKFDKKLDYNVFEADVLNLPVEIFYEKIDCIVSEGYLGKAMKGNESLDFIKKQIKELEKLYLKSFENFLKIKSLKNVVISMPVFIYNKQRFYLEILDKIQELGFKQENLLDEKYLNERATLIYKREDQKVYREIVKFVK
ncbi:MAG: DNA methyltransferase [Patescibacteria group bacterium]|nr:DNA methyltransferase [Patescibacteria group bacterium]